MIAQVGGRLKELRKRINAVDMTDPQAIDSVIADVSEQIADYDPDDVPFTGLTLTRDICDEDLQLLREANAKLQSTRDALDTAGELGDAERQAIARALELLRIIEQYIRLVPYLIMESILESLSKMSVEPGSPGVNQAVETLKKLDVFDRREAEHLAHFMTTLDPLGIFLRGFVLIEASLNRCFQEFLARPLNLYAELDLYISGKIKLAYALGFLNAEERELLSALNKERNKLVHEKRVREARASLYVYCGRRAQAMGGVYCGYFHFGPMDGIRRVSTSKQSEDDVDCRLVLAERSPESVAAS